MIFLIKHCLGNILRNFKLTPSKYELNLKHIEKLGEGQFEAETKNYIYFYEVWLKGILGYDLDENIIIDEKEESRCKIPGKLSNA